MVGRGDRLIALVRNEEGVATVTRILAYPAEFGLTLSLRLCTVAAGDMREFWPFH